MMFFQYPTQHSIFFSGAFFDTNELRVPCRLGISVVENIGQASGHARAEIDSRMAEHNHDAAGHVFTAMIANAFHHGQRSAVADGKPFAGRARDVEFTRGCAVKNGIAGENVSADCRLPAGADADRAAAQSLADIVVGGPRQMELKTADQKRAKTLPGRSFETELQRLRAKRT